MASQLPEDANGNPIPALRLKNNGAHQINTTTTTARNIAAFSTETDVVSLYATEDTYIKFGDSGVNATNSDHFLPASTYIDLAIGPNDNGQNSYVAALTAATDGILYISEKA